MRHIVRCDFLHWSNYDFQNLYYDCKVGLGICRRTQKKYEILENIQSPISKWQKKYENLVEPSRTSQARFSYFFSLLVISYQIFIIFQSPQNWPLFHTFSVSLTKFARLSYFFNLLKWQKNERN